MLAETVRRESMTTSENPDEKRPVGGYRLSRRNTTAFRPWIRAVNVGENPRSTPPLEFQNIGV